MGLTEEVQQLLEQECEKHKMPGASLSYLVDGEIGYATYGHTDAKHPAAVTKETMFGIGSTSKTITATALMALAEQGKVSLDDRVVKHLPELPVGDEEARETVTVGQLFDHTSGWVGDGITDTGFGEDALERAVPALLGKAAQLTPPGTAFSYNNNAVTVAGHLVAVLHGKSFEDSVKELVLEPLGLANTFYRPWEIANRPHAVGHAGTPEGAQPIPGWVAPRFLGPAGGAFSSAGDVISYARFHLTGETEGKAPISEESRLLMREQRSYTRSGVKGAGVSWLIGERRGRRLIEHGGNLSNIMVSGFSMAPDDNLAVSVMGNSAAGAPIGQAIRDFLLDSRPDAPGAETVVPLEVQPDLAEYVGTYAAGQWDLEVVEAEGQLDFGMRLTDVNEEVEESVRKLFEANRTRAVFIGTDLITPAAAPGPALGDFVRDGDGRIAFFRTGLRLARRR